MAANILPAGESVNNTETSQRHELLEREAELDRLRDGVERATAGSGGLLLIEGPAGIGKTSLLAAGREVASRQGLATLAARAIELEREFPYGSVRQLLEPTLRAVGAERREHLLAGGALPAAAALAIDGPAAPAQTPPGVETLNGLYWLVVNLAEEGPLLIVLDDAHWADRDSLRFLAFLAPRLEELPVLALVAARSEEWDWASVLAATASDPASAPLVPAPLTTAASARIVASAFDEPAAPRFASACHEVSGGNPFYLHALLDELRRDRTTPNESAAEAVLSLGPRTVAHAIVARLARLSESASVLARGLAVLGDPGSIAIAAELAGLEPDHAAIVADELEDAGILGSERPPRFAHPIIRNAVYADMGRRERDDLHRRALEQLGAQGAAPERLAAHLLPVEPAGDPSAVATLRAAAGAAMARGAPGAAVAHLRRALAERPADSGPVLLELGLAESSIDGSAAVEHLRAAVEVTKDPSRRLEIVRALQVVALTVSRPGDIADVVAMLKRELERAKASGRSELGEGIEADLISVLSVAIGAEMRAEASARAERLAPGLAGDTPTERKVLGCLAFCRLHRGEPVAEAVSPARLALDRIPAGESPSPIDLAFSLGVLIRCDELELAERWASRALADARQAGSVYGLALAQWLLGSIAHRRGRLDEAVSLHEASLRGAKEYGARAGVQSALTDLVLAQIDRGALGDAAAALAASGLAVEAPETFVSAGELFEARGRLRLATGEAEAALEDFRAAAAAFHERADPGPGVTAWRAGAALAHLRLGDRERARALAQEQLALARRFGAPRALGIALQAGALAEGKGRDVEMLSEAVALLAESPARLEYVRVLVELGAALRRGGERRAAREPLTQGLELARACGAVSVVERAYDELRATGARPRKVVYTGVESLTPSEARVARLAATGRTNRDIAQELFVTVKTVEAHLGQVYRKLEIESRSQLTAALAGRM